MKLHVCASTLVLFTLVSLGTGFAQAQTSALTPDQAEIESAKGQTIAFISYEGPSSVIDTAAEIKAIGSGLGLQLKPKGNQPARAGDDLRYSVIRAADASKGGLDADILVLGPDAKVDTIRNLRWIVADYLSTAWGYSAADAATLATFVTIYNAVHRGDLKYFASKYKPVVQKELSADNAGLALKYSDWPGKTRIVVPLSSGAQPGKLGAIDTGAVSDKAVKQSLQSQPDKGVTDRQALVNVKEREAAQKQADADKAKADADAAAAKLAQDKAKADADRAALAKQTAAAPAAQPSAPASSQAAAANPPAAVPQNQPSGTASGGQAPAANQPAAAAAPAAGSASANNAATAAQPAGTASGSQSAQPASASLSTSAAAVAQDDKQVAADQKDAAAKAAAAQDAQAAADSKKAEAAQDRKDITADQKNVIATEVAQKNEAAAGSILLLKIVDQASDLAQLILVDPAQASTLRSSRLNSLHARSLSETADSFIAVAGLESKAGGVKLEKIDKTSLEASAEGKADMYPQSVSLVQADSVYAIAKGSDGKYYVAKFAASDLTEKARSKDEVMPQSLIRSAGDYLAVQAPDGSFLLFKPDTLEKAKVLKP